MVNTRFMNRSENSAEEKTGKSHIRLVTLFKLATKLFSSRKSYIRLWNEHYTY